MTIKLQGIKFDDVSKSFILQTYKEYPVERPPTASVDIIDFLNEKIHLFHSDHPVELLAAVTERGSPISFFRVAGGAMCLEPFTLKITMLCCMMSFYPRFTFIHYDPARAAPTTRTDAVYRWLTDAFPPMSISLHDLILVSRDAVYSYNQAGLLRQSCLFLFSENCHEINKNLRRPFQSCHP